MFPAIFGRLSSYFPHFCTVSPAICCESNRFLMAAEVIEAVTSAGSALMSAPVFLG